MSPPERERAGRGRPTKLTTELTAQILQYVAVGNFRETACAAVGVDAHTLRNWLRLGAKGRQPYKDFAERVAQAEAESEAKDIAIIGKAGLNGDWRAVAWRRERMNSKRWGYRVRVEVNEELEGVLDKLERGLDAATFRRVIELIADDGVGEAPPRDDEGVGREQRGEPRSP